MKNGPIKVLLVEDNPGDARLMRETLAEVTSAQFELTHVERLADALQRLADSQFDVVLSDLTLPDSRGLDTFTRVHAEAPAVPIVVLTGHDDDALALEAVHSGAQDYLVKGQVDGRMLSRILRYAIERKHTEEQLARYAEELRQKNVQMEADLEMGFELQEALLPQRYPAFPRGAEPEESALRFCQSHRWTTALGGDFFDVLQLSDTQAGVFICDVMGHGVRAALVTAMVHALVEEQAHLATEPGRFLTEINARLGILRQMRNPMFASAFYLVADMATGRMHFANAGHPSPFHLRRDAAVVEPLQRADSPHGPALGLFDNSEYPTCECSLARRDMVMLYTDGLYEVVGPDDEEYGEKRLLTAVRERLALPAAELFNQLLDQIQTFSVTRQFADDVCVVGMEVVRLGP